MPGARAPEAVLGGSSLCCIGTLLAWLALTALGLAHLAGVHPPAGAVAAAAALAMPTVLVAAARALLAIRRGPRPVDFELGDAVVCSPQDAQVVREAAQLRGTMGGAGHLHPRRLVLPAATWVLAAVSGFVAVADEGLVLGAWPPVLALVAAMLAFVFPARAFYYREVTGGGIVTSPPTAAGYLLSRREGVRASAEPG